MHDPLPETTITFSCTGCKESERKLKIAVEALERDRNNAAYDAGKADTNHDRDRFEHIRKSAEDALSEITPTP